MKYSCFLKKAYGWLRRRNWRFAANLEASEVNFSENQPCFHCVLDVSFAEDQCRVRSGFAAENLAVFRHMALNILKSDSSKNGVLKLNKKLQAGTTISS